MAQKTRRRIRTIEEDVPVDDFEPGRGEPLEDPDADVNRLMNDGTEGEIRIKLYRILISGSEEFKAWLPVVKDPEPYIQETWGEGKYVLKFYKDSILRGSRVVNIGAPVGTKENPAAPAAASNPVLDLVMSQNKILMEALVKGRGEQTPVGELIQGMAGLQSLAGGGNNAESMMKVFLDGINMGRSLGVEPEEKNGGFTGLIKELLPAFMQGMGGIKPALPAAPAPEGTQQVQTLNDPKKELAPLIAFLKGQAMSGVDPMALVHIAVANRGDKMYQGLLSFVLNSTWEQIQALDAELNREPYAGFFQTLTDGLRSELNALDSMGDDTGRESGDGGNVVIDAVSRKGRRGAS